MITEPKEEGELRGQIAKSAVLKVAATADSPIVVHYDHKLAAEAATHPKQRVPPFKDWHLAKCLKAWMGNRGGCQPADSLNVADEYIVTDGGKAGLMKDLLKVFKAKQHEVRPVTVMYLRNDILARRERSKDGSVNQIEHYYHATEAIANKPLRVGAHYGASSDGNAIGMVRLPASEMPETMSATPAEKHAIFENGARRWEVGGPGRLDEFSLQETAAKKARLGGDELPEPVFYHTPRFDFFDDELTTTGASAIVDMTPGAGYFLWAAALRGVPSLGVAMSEAHRQRLYNHMMGMCLSEMAKEGSRIHDPRFVKTLAEHGEGSSTLSQTEAWAKAKAAVAKAKAAVKAKAGGKGRGKKRAAADSEPGAPEAEEGEEGVDEDLDGEVLDLAEIPEAKPAAASSSSSSTARAAGTTPGTAATTAAEGRLLAKLAAMSAEAPGLGKA